MDDDKKVAVTETSQIQPSSTEASETGSLENDPVAERKLLRKLDRRLIPVVMPLYVLSFLDRINIGNARLYGLEEDLHLTSRQFQTVVSVLFITYIAVELPSNLFLKKIRPSRWLPFLVTSWGIVATLTGVVQNYASFLVCRLFLGMAEGAFTPGVLIYLTFFYTKEELALRIGTFFVSSAISGAIGGFLAYGIGHMDGLAGQSGWRWILILEGLPTIVLGISTFWLLADGPETAYYLTPAERELLALRKKRHTGHTESGEQLHLADFLHALKDWKIWGIALAGFGGATMSYGYSTFLPTLIEGIEPTFSVPMIQLLTIPCYVVGAVTFMAMAWVSDRRQQRGPFIVLFGCIAMVGYAVLLGAKGSSARYTGCFIIALGLYTHVGLQIPWQLSNSPRYGKRNTALVMQVMGANCGGIMMSFLYPKAEGPHYTRGHAVTLGLAFWSCLACGTVSLSYYRTNRRRAAGWEDDKISE